MRTLVRFLNFIVVLAITSVIYWHQFNNTSFTIQWDKFLTANGSYIMLFVSGLLVLFNLYTVFHTLKQMSKRKRAIEIENDNGVNSISIDAIQKRLSDMLSSTTDIVHPKLYLELGSKNKPIHCDVEFGLKCTHNITGRTDEIKSQITNAFNNMIPNSAGIIIKASIIDIESDGTVIKTEKDTVFSGPVYPTDEDDGADEKEMN